MINKSIIESWGIPKPLRNRNIKFIFNVDDLSADLKNDKIIEGLICDRIGSKFCIYDIDNKKIILTMNFIIIGISDNPIFYREKKYIKINCLCVNDPEERGNGIARYYLEKLIKFGLSKNINEFNLYPNPDDELFENIDKTNRLEIKDLKNFYIGVFGDLGLKLGEYDEDDNEDPILIFEKL